MDGSGGVVISSLFSFLFTKQEKNIKPKQQDRIMIKKKQKHRNVYGI